MISSYFILTLALCLFQYAQALQSGYTCETSVTLTCPQARKLVILEVTYASECPKVDEELNGTSIYAPSRCIGYYRERTSTQCNGQSTCTVDNSLEQRPSFFVGKQANCAFKGQSVNIEYSCIPDFYSSKLPRVDICSPQALDELREGFIHTPNYPKDSFKSLSCVKTVPAPASGHRLKIYAVEFDQANLGGLTNAPLSRGSDCLEINSNGNKFCSLQQSVTLLFDDVIEASIALQSANKSRSTKRFLLYFIVTSMRRSRPPTTPTKVTTTPSLDDDDASLGFIEPLSAAFVLEPRQKNNTGLKLLVILLCGILFLNLCAFILYKRRHDRRVRYLTDTFNSFFPHRSKSIQSDTSSHLDDANSKTKFIVSSSNDHEKYFPRAMDGNVSQIHSDHIYSQDPLMSSPSVHGDKQGNEDVIYETISSNQEEQEQKKTNFYANMYAIPKENLL